jgi:23S rRNA pseudouridine2457 synthase
MTLKYYVIYKPFGMLSQFSKEEEGNVTLADLKMTFDKDIYPVGRLDKDSEGLLILTNDKNLTDTLLNPQYKHWRTYWVQVEKVPSENSIKHLSKGVLIKVKKRSYKTQPAKVELLKTTPNLPDRNPPIRFRKEIPTAWLQISLTEGKNRQVRRMTANVGFPTLRLVRYNIVDLTIDNMIPGQIKTLEQADIYKLLQLNEIR